MATSQLSKHVSSLTKCRMSVQIDHILVPLGRTTLLKEIDAAPEHLIQGSGLKPIDLTKGCAYKDS